MEASYGTPQKREGKSFCKTLYVHDSLSGDVVIVEIHLSSTTNYLGIRVRKCKCILFNLKLNVHNYTTPLCSAEKLCLTKYFVIRTLQEG